MGGNNPVSATEITGTTFQIINAKLDVPAVALSIHDSIKFLENLKQGFKRIVWSKYRSKITTLSKNNLDYITDPAFTNIVNGDGDPTINCLISITCHY